jgi:hypothetical protein
MRRWGYENEISRGIYIFLWSIPPADFNFSRIVKPKHQIKRIRKGDEYMNHSAKLLRALILTFVFLLLTGCLPGLQMEWIPDRFATLQEVYAPGDLLRSIEVAPIDSNIKKVFNAPYEDVFRAAIVSAGQTQWLVEVQDKAKGVILATRVLQTPPPVGAGANCEANNFANKNPTRRNYYYAVVITEKGPKSIEVTALAKAQGKCEHKGCLARERHEECERYASVHWATGHDNAMSELSQFMVFINNHLIAAGVI